MNKFLIAGLLGLAIPFATVSAAAPQGFDAPKTTAMQKAPKGFDAKVMTIKQVKESARDDQIVVLEGKFTEWLRKDEFKFVDKQGDSITAELDKKYDWSHVVKDQPVRIRAEVDKDFTSIELDVLEVTPLK